MSPRPIARFLEAVKNHPETKSLEVGANKPFSLGDPDQVYVVARGEVDLFFADKEQGGRRTHLVKFPSKTILFGLAEQVLVVGNADCQVLRLPKSIYWSFAPELRNPVMKYWFGFLGKALSIKLDAQTVSALKSGLSAESFQSILADFHQVCIERAHDLVEKRIQQECLDLRKQAELDQERFTHTLLDLASVSTSVSRPRNVFETDSLLRAVRLVGEAMGMEVVKPKTEPPEGRDPLQHIALASQFRLRPVQLEGRWWKVDGGPLLAFTKAGAPVALLRKGARGYEVVDGEAGERKRVGEATTSELASTAFTFYPPLPGRVLKPADLVKYAFRFGWKDLVTIILVGAASGLLGLATPIAMEVLVNQVIPLGQRGELYTLAAALVVASLGGIAYDLTRTFAVLRLEGRVDGLLQTAIVDRLLNLPTSFFSGYEAADLARRALGVNSMRQILSEAVISAFLSAAFSVFSFGLLFYYDIKLACVVSVLVLIYAALLLGSSYAQLQLARLMQASAGKLSSREYQLINGISKIRVAAAQVRALRHWEELFIRSRRLSFARGMFSVHLEPVHITYQTLTTLVIFAVIAHDDFKGLDMGNFLAFMTAYGQFLGSVLGLTGAFSSVLGLNPIYKRLKPILNARTEVRKGLKDPGTLQGEVELCRVSFGYGKSGPLILKNISIRAKAGEFIAIVGASGSGKSTLLRILLGFEQPVHGTVLYDEQDLSSLDRQAVRQQLGVVLQDGRLLPGDIFTNIVGSALLSHDDAWEAARLAGLEEFIRGLPMGLHTVISEGAGGFSGGQKQRLMIARAVAAKPRILFLDEATSALDSRTQEEVASRLDTLETTRIVIAHRLSTIRRADRIYVLHNQTVAQCGTFDELMAQQGPFRELAQRQLA